MATFPCFDYDACVPSICTYITGTGATATCADFENIPITGQRLYTFVRMSYSQLLRVSEGLIPQLEDDIGEWYVAASIIQTIPYLITLLLILIYLIHSKVMGVGIGIGLIILLFIMTILMVLGLACYTDKVFTNISSTITNVIEDNFDKNESAIKCNLAWSIIDPDKVTCTGASGNFDSNFDTFKDECIPCGLNNTKILTDRTLNKSKITKGRVKDSNTFRDLTKYTYNK